MISLPEIRILAILSGLQSILKDSFGTKDVISCKIYQNNLSCFNKFFRLENVAVECSYNLALFD